MAKRKAERTTAVLHYPPHYFTPEDLLTFIHTKPFERRWEELGLTDRDLQAFEILIMVNPKSAPVVEGTDGLRKMRFAPPREAAGKSGGLRVCYAHFDEVGVVLLALVYAKSEADDLSADTKKAVRRLLAAAKQKLLSQRYRLGGADCPEET